MALPSSNHIQLGILRALWEAGGEADREDPSFYRLIAAYFPDITEEELSQTTPETGENMWTSKCQRHFILLAKRIELDNFSRDQLGLTDRGLARLQQGWLEEWGPKPTFADSPQA